MASKVTTDVWLQVEPTFSPYVDANGNRGVTKIRVANTTSRRPTGRQKSGTVLLHLKLNLPEAAFQPLAPTVTIEVPEGMLVTADSISVDIESPEA